LSQATTSEANPEITARKNSADILDDRVFIAIGFGGTIGRRLCETKVLIKAISRRDEALIRSNGNGHLKIKENCIILSYPRVLCMPVFP
jgi:hypothetical protein